MDEPQKDFEYVDFGEGAKLDKFAYKLQGVINKNSRQNIEIMSQGFGEDIIEPTLPLFDLAHLVLNCTWHARCVNLKSIVAAMQGWSIVPKDKEEKENAEAEKRINDELDKMVGKGSLSDLLSCVSQDLESLGNAYIEVVRDFSGRPAEFYHVPALSIRLRKTGGFWQLAQCNRCTHDAVYVPDSTTQGYSLFGGGFRKTYFKVYGDTDEYTLKGELTNKRLLESERATEIIHIKNYHPLSPYYGIPGFISAYNTMIADEAAEQWNLAFFENNRVPRWLFKIVGKNLSEKEKEDFRAHFTEQLKGRPHLPMLLCARNKDTTFEIEKLEADVNEGSFLDFRDKNRDAILAAHGVPPRMLGIISPGSLGGAGDAETQRKDFASFAVDPLQKKITNWLNDFIFPDCGWEKYRFVLKKFGRQESQEVKTLTAAYYNLYTLGVLSANEMRIELELPPIPEAWANEYHPFEIKEGKKPKEEEEEEEGKKPKEEEEEEEGKPKEEKTKEEKGKGKPKKEKGTKKSNSKSEEDQ